MVKAMREAKVDHGLGRARRGATSAAVRRFIAGLYRSEAFVADLEAVRRRGRAASARRPPSARRCSSSPLPASPTSTRATSCGASSLVDPDNRRPVDWERRPAPAGGAARRRGRRRRETAKLFLIHRALGLRARRPEAVRGRLPAARRRPTRLRLRPRRRRHRRDAAAAGGAGERIAVPEDLRGRWRDVLGDRDVELGAEAALAGLAAPLPVALLERAAHEGGDTIPR